MGLLDRAAEFFEIGGLGGWKMRVKRLDVVDAELVHHHGRKIRQLEARMAGPVHETAERVGSDCQAVAWRSGKVDIGRRGGERYRRGPEGGAGFDESAAADGWHGTLQNNAAVDMRCLDLE